MADSDKQHVPYLKVTAKPYPIPAALAQELAAIVIEWGVFENAISLDLEQLRAFAVAKKLSDAMPGAFGARLKLWRRSVAALFPTVKIYNSLAEEIYVNGRTVAITRHRLIHGLWRPAGEQNPDAFTVLSGLDGRREVAYAPKVDAAYLATIHHDIKQLSNAAWSFTMTRMLHGSQGLLSATPVPSVERPAPQGAPTPEKP